MENLLLALTNLASFNPLFVSYVNNDMITFYCVLFVSFFSFVSHLVENHKHDMPGIGFSKRLSYIMNRFDVLGCLIVSYRLIDLYINKYGYQLEYITFVTLVPYLFTNYIILMISEKYSGKSFYIFLHSIWHVNAYIIISGFLGLVIY